MYILPGLDEIRKRRIRLGISQRRMASYIGISQSALAKIESGRMNPSYEMVRRIFRFLDSMQSPSMGLVGEICSRPVVSVSSSDQVSTAARILRDRGFKQLPVRDGPLWVGSISERSISRLLLQTDDPRRVLERRVADVMDEALPMVPESTPITEVIPLLQHYQAVLTTSRGEVTGIVTNADLLKMLTSKL
jgi:predicted transcriptional regulator